MFFLVLTCEGGGIDSEAFLVWSLSNIVFIVPTLVLDFIKSTIIAIKPIRQMTKATPREIAEIIAGLHSDLPTE